MIKIIHIILTYYVERLILIIYPFLKDKSTQTAFINPMQGRLTIAFSTDFKESELVESQLAYNQAQNEVVESKKQLAKLELELVSVKRAAEMLIAEHDDALSTLKKQYDEELSSLLMASEQGYLHQYSEDRHLNDSSCSLSENTNCEAQKSSVQSIEKRSAQSLANQAFDKVEKLVRRVSHKALTNNFILNKSSLSSLLSNQEIYSSKEDRLRAIIEPYEAEIARLQQILINSSTPFNVSTSRPNSPSSHKQPGDRNSNNIFETDTNWENSPNTVYCKSNGKEANYSMLKDTSTNNNDDINEDHADTQLAKKTMCNHSVRLKIGRI
ncbi:unnamed protein product [Heterobilharzia americana]|nr:unnamed protein product [Heterobilharzia americana]